MPDAEPIADWRDLVPAALRLAARAPAGPIRMACDAWPAAHHGACGADVLAALAAAHPGRRISLHQAQDGAAMCGVVPRFP
jgi:hypothetical protein